MQRSVILLIGFLVLFASRSTAVETCAQHETCKECLRTFRNCFWCPSGGGCFEETEYCKDPYDPVGKVVERNTSDPVVKPTVADVYIRPNVPLVLTVSINNTKIPLEIVMVYDRSFTMVDFIDELKKNAEDLFTSMKGLESNSRMGATAFVDKTTFTAGLMDNCVAGGDIYDAYGCDCYPFRVDVPLEGDATTFANQLGLDYGGNWDIQESHIEAMVQAVVCNEELGWSPNTRKFVIVASDATTKRAGMGSQFNVYKPNWGTCNTLGTWFGPGRAFLDIQDYSSVGQWRNILRSAGVTPMFQTKDGGTSFIPGAEWSALALLNEYGSGNYSVLNAEITALWSLIETTYNIASRTICMYSSEWDVYKFATISPRCRNPIEFGEIATFDLEFLWPDVPSLYSALPLTGGWNASMVFDVFGFSQVYVTVYPFVDCNCTGIFCPGDGTCNNNTCDCGKCECMPAENYDLTKDVGKNCSCLSTPCSPPCQNGKCECNKCVCSDGWSNATCGCADCEQDCGVEGVEGYCDCGVCKCLPGYKEHWNPKEPVCSCRTNSTCATDCNAPVGGYCTSCGTCKCYSMYKDDGICNCTKAACPADCSNGLQFDDPDYEKFGDCECSECKCKPGYELGPKKDCNCPIASVCPNNCSYLVDPDNLSTCGCGRCNCVPNTKYGWPVHEEDNADPPNIVSLSYNESMTLFPWLWQRGNFSQIQPPEDCSCNREALGANLCIPPSKGGGGAEMCGECVCDFGFFGDNCACHNETDTCTAMLGPLGCQHGSCLVSPCVNALECDLEDCFVRCDCEEGWTQLSRRNACDIEIKMDEPPDECNEYYKDCYTCVAYGCAWCNTTVYWNETDANGTLLPTPDWGFYSNVTQQCYNASATNDCPWSSLKNGDASVCPIIWPEVQKPPDQVFEQVWDWLLLTFIITFFLVLIAMTALMACVVTVLFCLSRLAGMVVNPKAPDEDDMVECLNPLYEEKNETMFNPLYVGQLIGDGEELGELGGDVDGKMSGAEDFDGSELSDDGVFSITGDSD